MSRRTLLRSASIAVPTVLTLHSGSALALASSYVTASSTGDPVHDNYVCLDTKGQAGPRYYYGDGATATAISKNQLYVKASVLNGVDTTKDQKIIKAIEDAVKNGYTYNGKQLCADGQAYIPVTSTGPTYDAMGKPVTTSVSVKQGAMLSTGAYDSMTASKKLTTYML